MMFFFFKDTATTEIYTLSLHDALPIFQDLVVARAVAREPDHVAGVHVDAVLGLRPLVALARPAPVAQQVARDVEHQHRSEEHTSELQSRQYLVCRLLLEKKKTVLHSPH